MKIEEADELFTSGGFWRHMMPPILGSSIFTVGIGLISVNGQMDRVSVVAALGGVFLFVFFAQMLRYWMAGQKHDELKKLYGDRYVKLVEERKIPITPSAILMLGAPWSQARREIPEEGPYIPPR